MPRSDAIRGTNHTIQTRNAESTSAFLSNLGEPPVRRAVAPAARHPRQTYPAGRSAGVALDRVRRGKGYAFGDGPADQTRGRQEVQSSGIPAVAGMTACGRVDEQVPPRTQSSAHVQTAKQPARGCQARGYPGTELAETPAQERVGKKEERVKAARPFLLFRVGAARRVIASVIRLRSEQNQAGALPAAFRSPDWHL